MVIGLSGGYCSGKNLAASFLEKTGFLCLDVDRLGHTALDEGKAEVAARFGPNALDASGRVDRKALGAMVFGDPQALADLEAIVHPRANAKAESWLAANAGKDLCVNAALLHLMPAMNRLDAILEIRAPLALRLIRAWSRDRLPPLRAMNRIMSQKTFPALLRAGGVRVIGIPNASSPAALARRLERAIRDLREMRGAVP
jgi:dephospho-CoA kinase